MFCDLLDLYTASSSCYVPGIRNLFTKVCEKDYVQLMKYLLYNRNMIYTVRAISDMASAIQENDSCSIVKYLDNKLDYFNKECLDTPNRKIFDIVIDSTSGYRGKYRSAVYLYYQLNFSDSYILETSPKQLNKFKEYKIIDKKTGKYQQTLVETLADSLISLPMDLIRFCVRDYLYSDRHLRQDLELIYKIVEETNYH